MKKFKKILMSFIILVIVIIISTFLYYKNINYISENWNIDLPKENTVIYKVKPSPSFTNDGIYYEVQELKNKQLPVVLMNKKNTTIEKEFTQYIQESKISKKYIPDFTQEYKYYKKKDIGRSLIFIEQDSFLYIVSYNL